MKLKFYFNQLAYADKTNVYLIGENANGQRYLAKACKLEFEELKEGQIFPEPTLEFNGIMSREFFTALAAGLAEAGYKAESSDAGELKATKTHLEDMRKLALREVK